MLAELHLGVSGEARLRERAQELDITGDGLFAPSQLGLVVGVGKEHLVAPRVIGVVVEDIAVGAQRLESEELALLEEVAEPGLALTRLFAALDPGVHGLVVAKDAGPCLDPALLPPQLGQSEEQVGARRALNAGDDLLQLGDLLVALFGGLQVVVDVGARPRGVEDALPGPGVVARLGRGGRGLW